MDCPKCHKDIADTDLECPHCNVVVASYIKKLKKKAESANAPAVPRPQKSTGSPLPYIIVAIGIAAGLYFYLHSQGKTAEAPKPQAAAPAKPKPPTPEANIDEILPPEQEPGEHQYTTEQALAKADKLIKVVPGGQFRKNMVDKE